VTVPRLPLTTPDESRSSKSLYDERLFAADGEFFRAIVVNLPAAIYATDAEGRITFYNEAAAALWGRRPKLGEDWWCGSWRLYWPDGTPMAHDECPMAITLKTGKPARGAEAVAARPDGTRYPFIAYPTPLRNAEGKLVGAVNMLLDITDRKRDEEAAQRLAAVVESADDAIISKDLNSTITSWNTAAEQLFGYQPKEIVGRPVTVLIPPDHLDEEPYILERIRRGEHIDHYETIRQRKDGSLVEISLTVSPIKNAEGRIIGASKIARDITQRKRNEETRELLLNEIRHRVKNTLGTVQAIAAQTFRKAPEDECNSFASRIQALAQAHDVLTMYNWDRAAVGDLVQNALLPFRGRDHRRFRIEGPEASLNARDSLLLAMVLHELGTNAIKYGALSNDGGQIEIAWKLVDMERGKKLSLCWRESNGPLVEPPMRQGFGSKLIERALQSERSKARLEFAPSGVICTLEITL
jgi:two-component system, chemotaxis family, CheB/CheR fusion protein